MTKRKFTVRVARDATEYATVEVEAEDRSAAEEAALDKLYDDEPVWDLGEDRDSPYVLEVEDEDGPVRTLAYSQEEFDGAIVFLTSLRDKAQDEIKAMLAAFLTDDTSIKTPRSYSKLNCLCAAARSIRAAPGMSEVFNALKESLLEDN